jgi:hypothetical protein
MLTRADLPRLDTAKKHVKILTPVPAAPEPDGKADAKWLKPNDIYYS